MTAARTDQAALAGAALAAVIALAVAEGAWTVFDSLVGLSLLAVIGGHYRVDHWMHSPGWAITHALALGAMLGLILLLVLAWPTQWLLVSNEELLNTCNELIEGTESGPQLDISFHDVSPTEVILRGYVPSDYVLGAPSGEYLARIDGCVASNTTNQVLLPLWLLTISATLQLFVWRWRSIATSSLSETSVEGA